MATTWVIDPSHSEIQFKVRHLVISTVTGKFNTFEGSLQSDNDDFSGSRIAFTADINSISTNNEQRDQHLKSPDFFDAANHPKLTFTSTAFIKTGPQTYSLEGDLNLRGTTQRVVMEAELGGIAVDPWGQTKAGFEIKGQVSRKAYGLLWNAMTEAGGAVVADEVRLALNVQVVRQ